MSPEENNLSQALVIIAQVSGVHGILGQVKIRSFTEDPIALLNYAKCSKLYWNYNKSWELMPIVSNSLKQHGDSFLCYITNCQDRDEARKYQFVDIAVMRSALPTLNPNQYYWSDLEGMKVYTIYNGQDNKLLLGTVEQVFATGSNDVLVVNKDEKTKEYLIPYLIDEYILSVDVEKKIIIVDWDPEF